MRNFILHCTCIALGGLAMSAYALPIGFKGATMVMGDISPNAKGFTLNHAFSAQDSLGVSSAYMKNDHGHSTRQQYELTYTRLLKRLNGAHSQANLWLFMGVGGVTGNDFTANKVAYTPGLQVDYETTRLYASASTRLFRASGLKHDTNSLRAGFSLYEADYEQIQPWLVVDMRDMRGLSDGVETTPMLRLIHKSYFIEAGYSNTNQARLNFMYIF